MATKDFGTLSYSWTEIDYPVSLWYSPVNTGFSSASCGNFKLRLNGDMLEYEVTFRPNPHYLPGEGGIDYYSHFLKEFVMTYPGGSVTINNPGSVYTTVESSNAARTVTGSVAVSGYGIVTVRPNFLYVSGSGSGTVEEWATINVDYTSYTGSIPQPVPSCDITLNTASPYAGGNVSLVCTCGSGVTSGTVKRYYKAAGTSAWTNTTIQTGVTSRATITDTLPASYGGGQVYYRYEINNGDNYAVTATKTVLSNSAPTTPATLTVPTPIAGGSTITVSWSASTDLDGNLAGYILERSTDGGSTWANVYQGAELSTGDTIIAGTTRVRYRVKAYDTYGAESGYKQVPTSGDYTVTNNQAPTIPASPITITPSRLTTGIYAVITWGASTDPDGDAFEYVLERSADNLTSYTEIYRGTARTYTDTVGDWSSVSYRVKAQDVHGASSGYRTAETKPVSSNVAPTITCDYADGADLGTKSAVFSFTYSVNDENTSDALTVKEIVDGTVRKTISNAVRGQSYTFNFRTGSAASTSYWDKLLDGTHTVIIEVSDGKAVTRRTFTFLKNVGSCLITLKTAIQGATGKKLGIAAVSICGSIPDGCLTSVEVTADGGTHWESCKIASGGTASGIGGRKVKASADLNEVLLGGHYLFLHKFTNAGNQFNYRILCTAAAGKNGWISSVQGAFTEIGTSDTAVFG